MQTHYSNFDSKCVFNIDNSLLNNMKYDKLKKVNGKCKVTHALI